MKSLDELLAATKSRVKSIQKTLEQTAATASANIFLPGLNETTRAMPNHLARSSLFAPVARGCKKMHDGTILVSRGDAIIKFSGKQLDETQADVWMQALYDASKHLLGDTFTIERAAFLRAMGRSVSGQNYQWLHQSMKDLSFAMLVIEVTNEGKPKFSIGKTTALHMISGFDYDDVSESYTLRVDPRWKALFGNKEFALIDWDKRMKFGPRNDMAKALQRLVATSANPVQRYALDWLKDKMDYSSPMRKFKETLNSALRELERLEIIAGARIEASTKGKEQAVWTRL